MFISRATDYSFTITFLFVLRCDLSRRYGSLRPASSRQWRPLRELGSTTRAAVIEAGAA